MSHIVKFEDAWAKLETSIEEGKNVQMTPAQFKYMLNQIWDLSEKAKTRRVQQLMHDMSQMTGMNSVPGMEQGMTMLMNMIEDA
jgi:hypothetical protein